MSSRVLRRPLITLLTAVLLASVAACGGGSGAADAPAKADLSKGLDPANPITVTVGVPRNFGYLSTLWARDTQVPGVRIEYKYFPVFSDMLAALNAGQIDLTEVGDVGAISSYANGGQVVAVATTEPNPHNPSWCPRTARPSRSPT
ncbi:hypothetical protein [Acrocarpospora catenulata]|uniref:hypothetical protein n=1 Tax=Acrocarpospora catenulata TaxID=2836182 RepID=UPI001BDB05E0|nr:hypothetical protein [Acrocarpospora catenulata]